MEDVHCSGLAFVLRVGDKVGNVLIISRLSIYVGGAAMSKQGCVL